MLWSQIIPNWLLDSGNTLSVQVAQELRQGPSCKLKWTGGWQTLSPGSGDRMSTSCVSRRHCKPDLKMQCLGTRCELSSLSWSYGMWLLYRGKLSGGDTGVAFSWFRWSSDRVRVQSVLAGWMSRATRCGKRPHSSRVPGPRRLPSRLVFPPLSDWRSRPIEEMEAQQGELTYVWIQPVCAAARDQPRWGFQQSTHPAAQSSQERVTRTVQVLCR